MRIHFAFAAFAQQGHLSCLLLIGWSSCHLLQRAATEFFPCTDGKTGVKVDCTDETGAEFVMTHRFWTNAKVPASSALQVLHTGLSHQIAVAGSWPACPLSIATKQPDQGAHAVC